MNPRRLFTETPPLRLFFRASLPGAVGMLASALWQLLDGIFVGRFLGDTAFAALNLAMPLVIINFSLADLIGVGASVPISISLGRKRDREADNIFTCACILIVLTGAALGAALFAGAPLFIRLMGAEGEFARLAVQYLRVSALCAPLTTIVFAVDNFLRICGKIRRSMVLNILMAVLISVLEFVFLHELRFGLWGAALATNTGMFVAALLALAPFWARKLQLRFCRPKFSGAMIRQIVTCGAPNFLNNIAGRLTSILMNVVLVRLGGESAVSVYGILMYVEGFIQPLLYGMCDSLQPAVGYNWGAGLRGRVRAIERCCFTAACIVSLVSAGCIAAFPSGITRMFMADADGAFLSMAGTALRLFALTYLTRWFSFATQSYMLAIEKSAPAAWISVSAALLFPVALVALLWPLGLTGLWLNFAGSSLLAGVLSVAVMLRMRRELSQPDAPLPDAAEGVLLSVPWNENPG